MSKKVLFLSAANPMGIGGGSFASHAYLRAFSDLYNGAVDVVMADVWREKWDENIVIQNRYDAKPLSKLQYATSLLTGEMQRFSGVAARLLEENPYAYDCVVCNGSSISGMLWKHVNKLGIRLITIHHNYEPEFFKDNYKGLYRTLFLPTVRRMEKVAYHNSNLNLFLTLQDEEKFIKEYGKSNGKHGVIGVFEFDNYRTADITSSFGTPPIFVITGSLCTLQGIDGIKFFFNELFEFLPKDSKILIAGRNPSKDIEDICRQHKNVTLIPNPANISDVISKGDVYICPTRAGGGIKLRVMDGLKLGLPVITHSCSARGYDMMYNTPYFKSFSNSAEFKKSLEEILKSISSINKQDVISIYSKSFSYKAGYERFKKILCF